MDGAALFLLGVAGLLLAGHLAEILARKTGVPEALWLLAVGIMAGPVTGLVDADRVAPAAPLVAALALVVLLFEDGTRLTWIGLTKTSPRALPLAAAGFLLAQLLVAAGSMLAVSLKILPDDWTWKHGLLLGAILGAPASLISGPALTRRGAAAATTTLASLESALADGFGVLAAGALANELIAGAEPGIAGPLLGRELGIGLAAGVTAGLVGVLFLKALRGVAHPYPLTLAALLILHAVIGRLGGNPSLGILAAAAILGNAPAIAKGLKLNESLELGDDVRGFHSQMAFVIKALIFTGIGVLLGPPWPPVLLGAALAVVLLAARKLAMPVLRGAGMADGDPAKLGLAMPRGLTAGVLATLAVAQGTPGTEWLPAIVYGAVAASVLLFAILLPLTGGLLAPVPPPARPAWTPTWTPRPAVTPAAPTTAWTPAPAPAAPAPAAAPDPFDTSSLFGSPTPTVSAPAAPSEIKPVSGIEPDFKPGEKFRW